MSARSGSENVFVVKLISLVALLTIMLQFKEGGRSIRSSQVHILTDLFPGYIFPDIPAKVFADRKKRPHIPEVAEKLNDHRFLYDRDPKTPKDHLNGHMRNPCILQVNIVWVRFFCSQNANMLLVIRHYSVFCMAPPFSKEGPEVQKPAK
jgi:hypothetical protein